MECLRCDNKKMKQYAILSGIIAEETDLNGNKIPHIPQSLYVCDKCGYMELSANYCEEPDV